MNSPYHIEDTLDRLEKFSNIAETSPDEEQQQLYLYYSKLAILELSGWVEDRIDEMVLGIVADNTTDEEITEKFAPIVKQFSNFSYDQHFWRLLGIVVGVINMEEVENSISGEIRGNFRRALNELNQRRNYLAHRSLQSTQQQICDLSETKSYYRHIRDGLEAYEKAIKKSLGNCKAEISHDAV